MPRSVRQMIGAPQSGADRSATAWESRKSKLFYGFTVLFMLKSEGEKIPSWVRRPWHQEKGWKKEGSDRNAHGNNLNWSSDQTIAQMKLEDKAFKMIIGYKNL